MNAVERELRRQRRELLATGRKGEAELLRTYGEVYGRLRQRAEVVAKLISETDTPKVSWLVRHDQYVALLDQVEREVFAFGRQATEIIADSQRAGVSLVNAHTAKLVELSYGSQIGAGVAGQMVGLSPDAIRAYVGFASNNKPLGNLLDTLAPDAVQKVKDTLAYGITRGSNPRVIAQEFRKAASVPLDRALTISRTETMRAYRSASLEEFRANSDVIRGWVWVSELSTRTCPACFAMHGTEHTNDESLDGHPRCRCTMAPKTVSARELGFDVPDTRPTFESGGDVFARLSAQEQRSILGPGKYDAYRDGRIQLSDTVKRDHSREWGSSRREASLTDALAA